MKAPNVFALSLGERGRGEGLTMQPHKFQFIEDAAHRSPAPTTTPRHPPSRAMPQRHLTKPSSEALKGRDITAQGKLAPASATLGSHALPHRYQAQALKGRDNQPTTPHAPQSTRWRAATDSLAPSGLGQQSLPHHPTPPMVASLALLTLGYNVPPFQGS
jgi:hypothetical protein